MEENVTELAHILTDNPLIEQRIRETIEHHLKRGIDGETYINIFTSLKILVGTKARRLIVDSFLANSSKFFEDIREQIEGEGIDKVLPFLQYITALYGDELEKAYDLFGEKADDWRTADITAFREGGEKETWFIELDLTKNNGEKVYLRTLPWSALVLAQRLLREIDKAPKEMIVEELITTFNEEIKSFQEKFLGHSSKEN